MNEFTLQFDFHLCDVQIQSPDAAPIVEVQLPDDQEQIDLLQQLQQQQIEQMLHMIDEKLQGISQQIAETQTLAKNLAIHFSESFTELLFSKDQELLQARLNQYIDAGFAEFDLGSEITIWVHPDCQQQLEEYIESQSWENWKLESDAMLAVGDVHLEGPENGLMARLERQLEQARNTMLTQLQAVQS